MKDFVTEKTSENRKILVEFVLHPDYNALLIPTYRKKRVCDQGCLNSKNDLSLNF